MLVEGKVGIQALADGSLAPYRLTHDGSISASDALPRFHEPVYRGLIFTASTPIAGAAPQQTGGSPVAYWLANPAGSGINAVITSISIGYVSGTLGAGALVAVADVSNTGAVTTAATKLATVNNKLSLTTGKANAYSPSGTGGVTLTGTVTYLEPVLNLSPLLATSVLPLTPSQLPFVDGRYLVPPGCGFGLVGLAGAGTSPLILISASWAEVPV